MKILVTGGAGFIGSHLVNSLVNRGHVVSVIDNMSSAKVISVHRLQQVKDSIEFVHGDIRDFETIRKLAEGKDIVFHLAAQSDVNKSMENPAEDAEINIQGIMNILMASKEKNVKRVVFFGSAAVYGDNKKLPVKEDFPAKPISPYGFSKYTGEQYCKYFSDYLGLETFALRIFNVYGEGSEGVIYKFIDNIKNDKPLIVYGDGKQTRDYLSVHDVVDCCVKLLDAKTRGDEKFHLYNLANGKETKLNEIIKVLKKHSKKKFAVKYEKPRKGDIKRSVASIEKIKKELKFKPKVKLKEGIIELLK